MTTKAKSKSVRSGLLSGQLLLLSLCLAGPVFAQVLPPGVTNLPAFSPPPVMNTPVTNLLGMLTNVPPPLPLPAGEAGAGFHWDA